MQSAKKDIIYQGNSIISVEILPDYAHPVVIKKPSKRHSSRRNILSLEKEYERTRVLADVEGVRKVFEQQLIENQPALILEYIEGETLRETIERKELDLGSKLEIAIDIARILRRIHQKNIIHLDFNSKNIIIGDDGKTVNLIDLGAAARIDRSGFQKIGPDQMLGNLPYISPEQTGRINRTIDERSDLYSLGVVLFELFTGQLPFDSKNPMEIIHQHITKIPVSPSEVSSGIPEVLSAIILKLLSKNAEDRYQSAAGAQIDLETCLRRLKPDNIIEEFPLGETDYTSRLKFPQKLYGRESELKELESAFDSACQETSSMMFVGGYSGIGKTALVEEIQKPVSENKGYFIRGKFDQYLRTTPYSGIMQAFEGFISQILAEPEENFKEWREKIQSAVGNLSKVLTNIAPALEELLGPQPDVPELGGQEAENRFNFVIINFLSAAAAKEHPLAIFIDDLQWIDAASLRLLKVIETDFDQSSLLVIGAYRDNEVDNTHPLMDFIRKREEKSIQFRLMKLNDLNEQHLEALLSDTFKTDKGIKELGEIIFEKTHGNPFFSRRLLTSLNEAGLIFYDSEINNWVWNIADIKSETIADNVADLLAKNIAALPEETKNLLTLAACIGNRFDIPTLALISGLNEAEVLKLLAVSLSGQYVLESDYAFEFVHDQVQQVAYKLIDEKSRIKKHIEIARLFFADTDESKLGERIFDIATHYNLSLKLLTEPEEKVRVAELNLIAGRKSKLSSAFAASIYYLNRALYLLGENKWQDYYQLTLDLYNEIIDATYLNIQLDEVKELFETIKDNVKNDIDSSVAYKTMIMSYVAGNKSKEAILLAEGYLDKLKVNFDTQRTSNLSPEEILNLPPMEDEKMEVALEIMMAISTPIIFSAPARLPSLFCTMLNIVSEYGNTEITGFVSSWHAMILCMEERYEEGNAFGQLAVNLLDKYPSPGISAKIMNMMCAWIRHWMHPVHELIDLLREYHHIGMQAGDFEWSLYCLGNYTIFLWAAGKPLGVYLKEADPCIKLCESKNQEITYLICSIFAQGVENLMGESKVKTKLEGKWFSENSMLPKLEGNHLVFSYYRSVMITLCYLFGEDREAFRHFNEALKIRYSLNPHYTYTKISFYGGLICIASLQNDGNEDEKQEILEKLEQCERELKLWADLGPKNYQHQYDLMMAEKSKLKKENWEAVQLYEAAINGAKENKFVHDEALANELCARFWQERGNEKIAKMYMREALALYYRWGAYAKVDHLEKCYPQWFQAKTIFHGEADDSRSADKVHTTITEPITPIQLDMESIISAAQLLSAETDLEQLLTKMITLVMANSGAEKAVLLLKQDNDWLVQARGDSASEKYDVLLNKQFDPGDIENELIPEAVFNYYCRIKEALIVADAGRDNRFKKDRMIQSKNIKSLACIPVFSHGDPTALLYLDNSKLADVFTLEHIEILKHLSSQFGISVENALLYDNLNQKIRELQESESRFRSLVEHSNEAIVVAQDKTVKYSNPRVSELIGYTPEEVYSLDFIEFIHREDRETVLREYQSRVSGERPTSEYTVRIITKDGQEKYVIISSALIDWDGRPAALAMLTDITELKHTEEELVKSEEHFRKLIEQSPLPMELLTPDGKINQVNPAWRKLWNVNEKGAEETLEKYNMITDPQLKKLGVAELVKKAFSGEHIILPPIIYDADLTITDFEIENLEGLKSPWIQCHLYPIKDANDELEYIVNTYVDITDLRQAEKNIRESEKRFQHLIEFTPLAISIWRPDGKNIQVNDAWRKLWGLSEEEAAQVLERYNFLTDEQVKRHGNTPLLERAFKGDQIILPPMEYIGNRTLDELELKDIRGSTRWIQIHLHSVKNDNGEIEYVICTNADLTELKQAEVEAQGQRKIMAQLDRSKSLGQLTGAISHELNQPLTGILSNAQAAELLIKNDRWKKEELLEIMAEIVNDTKRSGAVIRNLRELYRYQTGKFSPIAINTIIEDTVKILHSEFVIHNVDYTMECDSSNPMVNGNKIQIEQVLVNLLINAYEAMSNLAKNERRLHIRTLCEKDEVKVWVDDYGPGIDTENIDKIFEPLATWKPGGTGMGLAISNSLITAHKGRMWAENRPEGGACVGFILPLIKKEKKHE